MIEHGKIANLKIYGDFFGTGDVHEVEEALTGVEYSPEVMTEILNQLDLQKYFAGSDTDEVTQLLTIQE